MILTGSKERRSPRTTSAREKDLCEGREEREKK